MAEVSIDFDFFPLCVIIIRFHSLCQSDVYSHGLFLTPHKAQRGEGDTCNFFHCVTFFLVLTMSGCHVLPAHRGLPVAGESSCLKRKVSEEIVVKFTMYFCTISIQEHQGFLARCFTLNTHTHTHTHRSVGFTGEASEAVHYALHYLGDLVEARDGTKISGRVSHDQMLRPHLQLPDVFELLHHGNQVTPMFILESIVGE